MPELPEVEVVRRGLDAVALGRTVARVDIGHDRAVRREPDPAGLVAALTGRVLAATSRVGKFLVVHLDAPSGDVLVVHLGMSGRLRVAASGTARPKHTHVVLTLDDDRELRFVDPRTFGQMFRSSVPPGGDRPVALAHLGPDARDGLAEPRALAARLAGRAVRVKLRLMDQSAVAGLGNIYSDEICFRAGVSGARPAGSLVPEEVDRLHQACVEVLDAAIAAGGSSLADGQYVDVAGNPGRYQHQHAVHARAGQPCPRCGAVVVRERIGTRSAYGCPTCQH